MSVCKGVCVSNGVFVCGYVCFVCVCGYVCLV